MWWFSLISIAFAALCFSFIFIFWRNDFKEALIDVHVDQTTSVQNPDLEQTVLDSSNPTIIAKERKERHNRVYKRWGAALIILGLGAGFTPSIIKAIIHRHVWDVGTDEPHSDVDSWLYGHIAGGLLWGIAIAQQLYSGGSSVEWKKIWHRFMGWTASIAVTVGIAMCGGLVWTIHYDFLVAETFNVGAGAYTIILSLAASFNMFQAVRYARKRQFGIHKDYALMAIMWTMDPAVHRAVMWFLHLLCYSCFTPDVFEGTDFRLSVIAKMPANVILFSWTLCIAIHAHRINTILIVNGSGQYLLWILQIANALKGESGMAAIGTSIVLILMYLGVCKYGRMVIRTKRSGHV